MTCSTIAILNSDKSVESIYAHWHGNISENGVMLYQHYKDINKIRQLITLGSLITLQEEIIPPLGVVHSFAQRYSGVTVFFSRDRDDSNDPKYLPGFFESFEAYLKHDDFQANNYIFQEKLNQWYVINTKNGKLKRLETAIMNDNEVGSFFKDMNKSIKLSHRLDKELKAKTIVEKKVKL